MCFTLAWLQSLLVYLVIVGAVVAILKLLIPYIASQFPPVVGQALNIVLWAVICILVIYICFALISCLAGNGFPLPLPHR